MLRCVLTFLALAISLPTGVVAQDPHSDVPRVARLARDAVVSIHAYDERGEAIGQGSGFLLVDGRIVTNTHVLKDATRVEVLDSGGRLLGTTTFAESLSDRVDVAILPRLGQPSATLSLGSEEPAVGERIVVIGAPQGLTNTVSDGLVSAYRPVAGQRLMQISAPISMGSSGGPVLNQAGRVVGVTVALLETGQNLNFAVPAADIRAVAASPAGRVPFPKTASTESRVANARSPNIDVRDLAPGERAEGRLQHGDFQLDDGSYADVFAVRGERGTVVTVELQSADFDAYLAVVDTFGDDAGRTLEDDDGGGGTNARLEVEFPRHGALFVVATSYDTHAMGRYTLSVSARHGASRWAMIGESDDGENWAFDRRSVRRQNGNRYRVWARGAFQRPRTLDEDTRYDRVLTDMEVDCTGHRLRPFALHYYLDGESVYSTEDEPGEWTAWVPGSVGEAFADAVCESQ